MDFLQLIYFWVISRLPLSFIPARYKNSRNIHLRGTGGFCMGVCASLKNTIPSPYLPLHHTACKANKPSCHQALEEGTKTRSSKVRATVTDQ